MRKTILLITAFLSIVPIWAQLLHSVDQEVFSAQISLVDEFIRRFNGEELHPLVQKEKKDAERQNLLMLLDYAQYKSKNDSAFGAAELFIDLIIADSIKIHYRDSNWIARAECHGTLKGKSVDFILFLQVEQRTKNMYKWVITSAKGEIFNLANEKKHEPFMLMPDDHETNFMSLNRMTNETSTYIMDFVRKDAMVDELSVFMTLVKQGLLKIDYVSDLSFTFFQVPGYIFSIRNINRNSQNTGWLIDSIQSISEQQKTDIYNEMSKGL